MKKNILYFLFLVLSLFVGCDSNSKHNKTVSAEDPIKLYDLDSTVAPQNNFYLYANGGWLKNADIPKDRGSWGNYTSLRLRNNLLQKELLETGYNSNEYPKDSNQDKAINFFHIGMDSAQVEQKGKEYLLALLEKIEDIDTYFDLQHVITLLHQHQINPFFKPTVFQDLHSNKRLVLYFELSGISIHNTDFYALQDSNSIHLRVDYVKHISNMFKLIGYTGEKALSTAKTAYMVEENIAEQYNLSITNHNHKNYYNPKSTKELTDICQTIIWKEYLKDIGSETDTVVVTNTTYFSSIDAIILKNGLPKIKNYLKWRLIHFSAPYLPYAFVEEDFKYFGKKRDGLLKQPPRWKSVLAATNKSVGFAVGEMYIAQHFNPDSKVIIGEMIQNIKQYAYNYFDKVEWMDPLTKKMAKKKVKALTVKVGYPDKFPSYKALELSNNYLKNVLKGNAWNFKSKINQSNTDRSPKKWIITPQTVNAYYHTLYNEFVITAGILQPPFFYIDADIAINYGAIGTVIAHEITHGFDNIGREYNADGKSQNWWSAKDYYAFKDRTKRLIDQFNKYEPIPGVHVNGNLTLNENIADLSGLSLAYNTFEQQYSYEVAPSNKINGFTAQQRFFLSWATLWRSKTRAEVMRTKLLTETHSPGEFRVNGPLSNFTPFYNAFNVEKGDKMWRSENDRVVIW
ncbi:M13 family peptidase [Flammeovirga pectinis]|uniref:M13 family peptidase n=1 Tax=Flammeovirga pectinis TaxID=2494373 RepID=A0A3S9NZJ6_9BACT|nr:M13 family metallopeptidase [Flammeovirga pectinis]AZQ61356.1 M13 family peptidase [Flammeovirga pectinis]